MRFPRRDAAPLVAALLSAGVSTPALSLAGAPSVAVAGASTIASAAVTDRVFIDIRIIQRYDVEVLEDAAVRGRLVFGLFGREAPLGTKKFLEFVDGTSGQFKPSGGGPGGGPAYSSGSFHKIEPGVLLEGGRINGLKLTEFAGQQEYEYMSRLLPLRPVVEVNNLRHEKRGLLTRAIFNPGPEFGVTLASARSLDGTHEVIGQLEEGGEELLRLMEQLPYISGKSREGEGTTQNAIFTSQQKLFQAFAKSTGDSRAEDRTGLLLRRVEITRVGRL